MGRAELLLRAPLDWAEIAGWGVRSRAHDPRVLVQGVVSGPAGVLPSVIAEYGLRLPAPSLART